MLAGNTASMEVPGVSEQAADPAALEPLAAAGGSGAGSDKADEEHDTAHAVDREVEDCPEHHPPEPRDDEACEGEPAVVGADLWNSQAPGTLQDADSMDVADGVKEVADDAQEWQLSLEEPAAACGVPEAEEDAENVDLLEEEGPPPLELPDELEETAPEAVHADGAVDISEEPCSEVLHDSQVLDGGADGAHKVAGLQQEVGIRTAAQVVCADVGSAEAVEKCISESMEENAETLVGEELVGAPQAPRDTSTLAEPLTQDDGGGRATRDSEVAEGMVDELLEETLVSMLSADAQQYAQQ